MGRRSGAATVAGLHQSGEISFAFQKEEDPRFGFWSSAPEKSICSLKDVTLIVKTVLLDLWIGTSSGRSERSKEGQGGQRKKHPQESLIMAPGSELQVLLLFVYVLTSVFCPNEAASIFFCFFLQNSSWFLSSEVDLFRHLAVCCLVLLCSALTRVAPRWAIKRCLSKKKEACETTRRHVQRVSKEEENKFASGMKCANF